MMQNIEATSCVCMLCGKTAHPKQLLCADCHYQMASHGQTKPLPSLSNDKEFSFGEEVPDIEEKTVVLFINNQRLFFPVQQCMMLGRIGSVKSDSTSVDLSRFDARALGVSRYHAQLLRKNGELYLIDMQSRNGSHLNHRALLPMKEYRVYSGDEIRLGNLSVKIYF
jgi:hypothetical protein